MRNIDRAMLALAFLAWTLGFVSLLLNCRRAVELEARRKARLVGWSFAIGVVPWMALLVTSLVLKRGLFDLPFWLWVPCALLMMLVPVLFGYAVVKHRVLEFSVLVRRSARYMFVQRGFVLLAVALSLVVTAVFVALISRLLPRLTDAALPTGIAAGTLFGLALFVTGGAVATQVTRRIDRAFFRSAYDARRILEDLARQTGLVQDRDELAALLDRQLRQALHPRRLDVYLRDRPGALRLVARGAPDSPAELEVPEALAARFARRRPALHAARRGPAVPGARGHGRRVRRAHAHPATARSWASSCFGSRLSDEPYSGEDETLLASIAGQAGGAMESLLLAEQMAERMEADRRAAQEVHIAAEVQRRLLPVKTAAMATIEYEGRCVQARSVGGDYYDFLDLGRGQLGLVLGDVSGKGLYAALLMANLQANVRSLSARLAGEDLDGAARPASTTRSTRRRRATTSPRCSSATTTTSGGGCATPTAATSRRSCCGPAAASNACRDGRGRRAARRVDLHRAGGRPRARRPAGAFQRRRHRGPEPPRARSSGRRGSSTRWRNIAAGRSSR